MGVEDGKGLVSLLPDIYAHMFQLSCLEPVHKGMCLQQSSGATIIKDRIGDLMEVDQQLSEAWLV